MFARFDDTCARGKEVALGRVWFGFGESLSSPAPNLLTVLIHLRLESIVSASTNHLPNAYVVAGGWHL
ncbi:MAG: hypothetical protein ACPGIA_03335 [Luteolibacter sp.]